MPQRLGSPPGNVGSRRSTRSTADSPSPTPNTATFTASPAAAFLGAAAGSVEWQDSYRSDRCAPRPVAWGEPVITRKVLDKMWPRYRAWPCVPPWSQALPSRSKQGIGQAATAASSRARRIRFANLQ